MMYWTVVGDHSLIEEAAMDGSMRRILVEKNLRRPSGRCSRTSGHVTYNNTFRKYP
jgi:hypothetical protein